MTLLDIVTTVPLLPMVVASPERQVVKDLQALREWFSDGHHWCQHTYGIFIKANGDCGDVPCEEMSHYKTTGLVKATCLLGGVYLQVPNNYRRRERMINALKRTILCLGDHEYCSGDSADVIVNYNDFCANSVQDINSLIDLTIQREQGATVCLS
jgi:hypothetical protein